MEQNLEYLLSQFNQQAEKSKAILNVILSIISKGHMPDQISIDTLNSEINDLGEKYDAILQMASDSSNEDSSQFAQYSVEELSEVIRNCELERYREQLEAVKNVIKQFMAVSSLAEAYAKALRPYQEKASELLGQIGSEQELDLEELSDEIAGPEVFLEAMQTADFSSDEGIELLIERIPKHFNNIVQVGLAAKMYYLEEDAVDVSEAVVDSDTEKTPEENECTDPSQDEEETQTIDEKEEEYPDQDSDDNEMQASDTEDNAAEQENNEKTEITDFEMESESASEVEAVSDEEVPLDKRSAFISELKDRNAFIDSKRDLGDLKEEISPRENDSVNVSIFKSEIHKIHDFIAPVLIHGLISDQYLTKDNLSSTNPGPNDDKIQKAIEDLFEYGYFRKYSFTSGNKDEEVYLASGRLLKALSYKGCRDKVYISNFSLKEWKSPVIKSSSDAASLLAMSRFDSAGTHYLRGGKSLIDFGLKESKKILSGSFVISMYDNKNYKGHEVGLGAFWDKEQADETFIHTVESFFGEIDQIHSVTIASYNVEKALALTESLLAVMPLSDRVEEIYLYSWEEDQYYTYSESPEPCDPFGIEEEIDAEDPDEEALEFDEKEELQQSDEVEVQEEDTDSDESELECEAASAEESTEKQVIIEEGETSENDMEQEEFEEESTPAEETLGKIDHIENGEASASDQEQAALQEADSEESIPNETEEAEEHVSDIEIEKEAEVVQVLEEESPQKSERAETQDSDPEEDGDLKPELPLTLYPNVYEFLADGKYYAASAYVKALSLLNPEDDLLYKQLAYALNDPMGNCVYSSDNAFNLIKERNDFADSLVIATAARTFFFNDVLYDYNVKSFYESIKGYPLLDQFPSLSKVIYTLMDFKNEQNVGIDEYADYRMRSQSETEDQFGKIRNDARIFYDSFILNAKRESTKHRRFLDTRKMIFSVDSNIGQNLKSIVENDRDPEMIELMEEFLKENFYKEDSIVSEDTIDQNSLWEYIVGFWNRAGEAMTHYRKDDLKSSLRNNLTSAVTKAVQILAGWCRINKKVNNSGADHGSEQYQKIRAKLLENIDLALDELKQKVSRENPVEFRAGMKVMSLALTEIRSCIDGSFDESEHKYFYAPFLLTDDLLLDENYIPDMDTSGSTLITLQPAYRICQHVLKLQGMNPDYRERLNYIVENNTDEIGTARLIIQYLMKESVQDSELDKLSSLLEPSESYAKDDTKNLKMKFIGELELAQSYGQIDNSIENKKEKVLQIVDEWYSWAEETANYGFFKRVMDCYLQEIKRTAKEREPDLRQQLEDFEKRNIPGMDMETKKQRAEQIRQMINVQNYTVAEDLLVHADMDEDAREELFDEDFLKDFLNQYDDYYRRVSNQQSSFSSLVSKRTRNKEMRGGRKLADNWLPGGSRLGEQKLVLLLSSLGFKVSSNDIKPQSTIGKFEHYTVKTLSEVNGKRVNYTHPVAAFGSGSAKDGFRVVCMNGQYNADRLIDVMKDIGNTKHTLILLDYALTMSERRRLARKTKNSLEDKLFCVIDRTVMMYLVQNYDENKVNRMLISLIMPFGYYQPYVWESAMVMPPEIFMGRKHELERIKSPEGINIVYGGRQLGKSALLKKAKSDIDHNENGDRAVYIDIKGLDYKQTARKIGNELFDHGILPTDPDTEDWSKLTRVIKQRLMDEKKKIPYLLLLLDEADKFIDSCEEFEYRPFDALKEIQSIDSGRFKFVVAGLRNVVRFKSVAALSNNRSLTHLQSMTVKPFNVSEARELLEIPLHYLGLRFPEEKEYLITLILATTNYFPGLIQMYCAKLLEALRNKDYAGYDESDTPVYKVSEKHIKKVLADPEFMEQIEEKFIITLRLDEDNYYYLIALLFAYQYHTNGYRSGYSAEDIKNTGTELGIGKIADLEIQKLKAFLEELRELNVLRHAGEDRYLFTRFTFFQMMGTTQEVENGLLEYMES